MLYTKKKVEIMRAMMRVKLLTITIWVSVMFSRKLKGDSFTIGSGPMSGRSPKGSMLCLKGTTAGLLLKGAALLLLPNGLTAEADKGTPALGLLGAAGSRQADMNQYKLRWALECMCDTARRIVPSARMNQQFGNQVNCAPCRCVYV